MNATPDERLARYVFGELRLIDLWEDSRLEGLMILNGIERMTAGLTEDGSHTEFLSPDGRRFTFEATTVVKLDGLTATFAGPAQHRTGPAYTLILNRKHEPLAR